MSDRFDRQTMAQLLIRKIDEDLEAGLKERAARHGISLEEEVRTILTAAVRDSRDEAGPGTQIASLFQGIEGNDEPLEPFPWDTDVKPRT